MSLIIRDCLNLQSLKKGKVIAGFNGLDEKFDIVTTLEYTGVELDEYSNTSYANEIILTAFASIRNDVEEQCKTLHRLKESGVVCVIIYYVGIIMKTIDKQLIDTANEINLPIIVMPKNDPHLKYSDAISEIYSALLSPSKDKNYLLNTTMSKIVKFDENERIIINLITIISYELNAIVCIKDGKDNIILSSHEPLEKYILTKKYIEFSTEFTDSKYLGYKLYIYALEETPISNLDLLQSIETIQLFSLIWNYDIRNTSIDLLIPSIIDGDTNRIKNISSAFNIQLDEMKNLILLNIDRVSNEANSSSKLISISKKVISEYKISSFVNIYEGILVILSTPFDNKVLMRLMLDDLDNALKNINEEFKLTLLTNIDGIEEIAEYYKKFYRTNQDMEKLYPEKNFYHTTDLDFVKKCSNMLKSKNNDIRKYQKALSAIAKNEDTEQLLSTLSVFLLDANMSTKTTSELMYIHKNTVLYRIKKIKTLFDYDFTIMPQLDYIYTAIALNRLLQ